MLLVLPKGLGNEKNFDGKIEHARSISFGRFPDLGDNENKEKLARLLALKEAGDTLAIETRPKNWC